MDVERELRASAELPEDGRPDAQEKPPNEPFPGVSEATAEQFLALFCQQDLHQTALLWLHAAASNLRRYAPRAGRRMRFLSLEDEHAVSIGLLRGGRDLWVLGAPRLAAQLAQTIPGTRTLWLDSRLWVDPAFDAMRSGWEASPVYTHLRRPPSERDDLVHEVGPARPVDIPQLRALDHQQYGSTAPDIDYDALIETGASFVARSGPRVICTALIGRPPGFVTVSSLWTQPGDRRQGHARRLMRGVLASLCRPHQAVCALNVDTANEAANQLYRQLGFVPHGQLTRAARRARSNT